LVPAGSLFEYPAKGQRHKVFEPSDAKRIYTDAFFHQKLNNIHHNPVTRKWRLNTHFAQYAHNSAAFYETATEHILTKIKDYREVGIGLQRSFFWSQQGLS
jgi:hypothetical protein